MDDATLLSTLRQLEATPDNWNPDDPALWAELLRACATRKELRACVLVYDAMVARKVAQIDGAIATLNTVHSKNIVESDTLLVGPVDPGKLKPARRIHKICKAAAYSENYNAACQKHLAGITDYLDSHPKLKTVHKDRLSKILSKECKVPIKDVKYVITKLKRTKYLLAMV